MTAPETPPADPVSTQPGTLGGMDGIGCLGMIGLILCGTIFAAPVGVAILLVTMILAIVQFIRRRLAGGRRGICPSCQADLLLESGPDTCRCHSCQAALSWRDDAFQAILPADAPDPETLNP